MNRMSILQKKILTIIHHVGFKVQYGFYNKRMTHDTKEIGLIENILPPTYVLALKLVIPMEVTRNIYS